MSQVAVVEGLDEGPLGFANREARTRTPNFDRLAGIYRWMEWLTFGPWLWHCRCAFLRDLDLRRKVLVLGDGDGRFTARLLHENRSVLVEAVDASSAMLAELKRRAGPDAGRVSAQVADLRVWEPGKDDYDAIVSHFFLDCLTTEEIAALATRLRKRIGPDAVWMVSEFAVPGNWFGRTVAQPLVSCLYRGFGLLTGLEIRRLPDHRTALGSAGFALIRQHRRLGGLLISEVWSPVSKIEQEIDT